MLERNHNWLRDNQSPSILIASTMALLLLFIWIDLPLARRSLKKGWRVYQLSKISGSLESLDRRIEEEKLRDDALAEKMMKSQMGQAAGSVSPVIDLINESARQSSRL